MRRSALLTLTLAGICGCGLLLRAYGEHFGDSTVVRSTSARNSPARPEPPSPLVSGTARIDATRNRQLLQKLAQIEARLDHFEAEEATRSATSDEGPPPSLTPEERVERNRSRIRRIDKALENEPRDGRWSLDTSRVLQDLFSSMTLSGSSLSETTCGATFCRLIVTHESSQARNEFEVFAGKVPGMGARGLVEHHEDGTARTTLYVVRKEYDTPEHPVRVQDSTG